MLSDEQLREFERMILDWYPMVRDSILFYQMEERARAIEATTELRDVLDHFAVAVTVDDEEEKRTALRDALDHLRSVAVEPLERAVEDRFATAQKSRMQAGGLRGMMRRFLLVGPPSSIEIASLEAEIREHIRDGRANKSRLATAPRAIREFKMAHRKIVQVEALYRQKDVDDRKFQLFISVVVSAIFLVIGAVLF